MRSVVPTRSIAVAARLRVRTFEDCAWARFALATRRTRYQPRAGSFRLGARDLDYLAPLLGFVGDELGQIGGGAGEHRGAEFGNPRLHLGGRKRGVDLAVELVNNLGGCARAQADD